MRSGEDNLLKKINRHRTQQFIKLSNEVTVVIPTLNEEEGICSVIEKTQNAGFSKILIIDGGSSDQTCELAKERGVGVLEQHGRGKTDAFDSAISFVDTTYMALIDGDDSYDPDDIRRMLDYIEGADLVIGSRTLGEMRWKNDQSTHFAPGHGMANRMLNFIFNKLFGVHLTDVLSGIRLFNMQALRDIHLRSSGFTTEAEVTAEFLMGGWRVIEVPAQFKTRAGRAKLRYRDGFHILNTIVRLAYEYNPLAYFLLFGMLLMIPGLTSLGYVGYEAYITGAHIFHSGYALAGLGLFLTGLVFFSLGMTSLVFKRLALLQLRTLRRTQK